MEGCHADVNECETEGAAGHTSWGAPSSEPPPEAPLALHPREAWTDARSGGQAVRGAARNHLDGDALGTALT